jgi:hypothetical protein
MCGHRTPKEADRAGTRTREMPRATPRASPRARASVDVPAPTHRALRDSSENRWVTPSACGKRRRRLDGPGGLALPDRAAGPIFGHHAYGGGPHGARSGRARLSRLDGSGSGAGVPVRDGGRGADAGGTAPPRGGRLGGSAAVPVRVPRPLCRVHGRLGPARGAGASAGDGAPGAGPAESSPMRARARTPPLPSTLRQPSSGGSGAPQLKRAWTRPRAAARARTP